MAPKLFTVGYQGRSLDEMIGDLVDAGVERLVDVRELPLSRRRGFSKTALGDALRHAGIEYVHVRALGNPKPNRERYWAGDVAGGAAVYRKHLNNGSRTALVELADSLGDEPACLLCFERNHAECHRDVIVEALQELRPGISMQASAAATCSSGTPCHSWPSRITVRSRAGSSRGSAIAPSASSTATIRQPSARCSSTQRSLPVRTQWMHGWRPGPRVSPRASASR